MRKQFLWGNSVSSMQTEGAWNVDGKEKSVYDVIPASKNTSDWKAGIDEYHRYEEDFDLLSEIGMNCYRFQISWTRVFSHGHVNKKGMDYYHKIVDALLKRNIVPVVCLYHFDMPLELAEKYNGFVSSEVTNQFIDFSKAVVKEFSNQVKYWIVFNEQNCTMFEEGFKNSGYLSGNRSIREQYEIATNSLVAYAHVADYIHTFDGLKVGGMVAYQEMYPNTPSPRDILITRKANEFINDDFLSFFAKGKRSKEVLKFMKDNKMGDLTHRLDKSVSNLSNFKSDFLAFSYYYSLVIDSTKIERDLAPNYYMSHGKMLNKYLNTSEFGWQIDEIGFRSVITEMSNRYGLPIFPVENGIGAVEKWDGKNIINDDYRIKYHKNHILQMEKSIKNDGADVMGYLGWGLIDIPSSAGNMEKRYGLVYVNRSNHDLKDLKRVPKKSFYWFKDMINEMSIGGAQNE